MTESQPDEKKDPKASNVVLKSVRIKRPKSVIRTHRTKPVGSLDEPDTIDTQSLKTPTLISKEVSSAPSSPETASPETASPETASPDSNQSTLWKGAPHSSQSSYSFLNRIFQPNLQYKLFLLFLSIWGASFIMFYLSTTFAIILPEPFNLVVLGFFLISTSLSGIYIFLLGLQHLRNTRQSSDDRYY